MARGDDQEIGHAGELRALDRDLAVVGAGEIALEPGFEAAGAGDDADLERDGPQPVGQAVGARAQFLDGGPEQALEPPAVLQMIDDLAAVIGRRQHDDPSRIGDRVVLEILPDEDSAQGMGNEIYRGRAGAPTGVDRPRVRAKASIVIRVDG